MILPPYLPLFTDEFLGSVQTLTNEQLGAFVRLAFCGWHHPVADNAESIRQVVGGSISEADLSVVLLRFYSCGGDLKLSKIESMRKKYASRVAAGQTGGQVTARGRAIGALKLGGASA
jgi:uncharacterized protein YdaU (DUF1376 family)